MANNQGLLRLEEVAILVGVSFKTINSWYAFKRMHPDNEYAKMLPDYIQAGPRQTRYWKREDIWKFIQYHHSIPQGRNGVMGDVTQKYYRKGKINETGTENTGLSDTPVCGEQT